MEELHKGFLENSNVNSVQALTDMIAVQHINGHEFNQQRDGRIQDAITRLGRVHDRSNQSPSLLFSSPFCLYYSLTLCMSFCRFLVQQGQLD